MPASSAPTTSGDYRLYSSCSPAANTGLDLSSYADTTDADGNPRHAEGNVDMGAYEFQTRTPLTDSTFSILAKNVRQGRLQ
jgi:hypothetical protein